MFVDDNLTEDSPDIDYEIIKQSHTNEEYREIIGKGVAEALGGALKRGIPKGFKSVDEITIKVGDEIEGHKVISISKDPFVQGQIDIFTDYYRTTDFGDQILQCYRVRKEKK